MKTTHKRVLFLSPYPYGQAASQRLKYEQYFDYFESNGYMLKTSSFVNDAFWKIIYKDGYLFLKIWYTLLGYITRIADLFLLHKYDVVYVHLWVTPLGFPVFERLVCLLSKKVIYDIDDLVFVGQGNHTNKLISTLKGRTKSLYLIRNAHHVITCTPYLHDFALSNNRYGKATDISSTIDTERFVPVDHYDNNDVVCLGWTGTHSTSRYLYLLSDTLRKLAQLRTFKLVVIGNFECNMEGVEVEMIQWTKEHEIEDLRKIDIGLYPLPVNDWVMGKSGLKALQYMAIGLPTVATDVGAIRRIIEHDHSGILVKTEQEWIDNLIQLIDSPERRATLGREGRKIVEQRFSIIITRNVYLGILEAVTN